MFTFLILSVLFDRLRNRVTIINVFRIVVDHFFNIMTNHLLLYRHSQSGNKLLKDAFTGVMKSQKCGWMDT